MTTSYDIHPPIGAKVTGPQGIDLIKRFESLRLEAYRCPSGIWTIGYGHTAGVRRGDRTDTAGAGRMLADDLREAEDVVNAACPALSQERFDALVSFVFNVGGRAFLNSTLLSCVRANPAGANIRHELGRWTKSGGSMLPGLVRRREAEADLYFSGG